MVGRLPGISENEVETDANICPEVPMPYHLEATLALRRARMVSLYPKYLFELSNSALDLGSGQNWVE